SGTSAAATGCSPAPARQRSRPRRGRRAQPRARRAACAPTPPSSALLPDARRSACPRRAALRKSRESESPLKETNSTTGRGPSGNRAGMKRAATTAGLLWLGCLVAGCGGGRASVERHLVFVRETAPENAVVWI